MQLFHLIYCNEVLFYKIKTLIGAIWNFFTLWKTRLVFYIFIINELRYWFYVKNHFHFLRTLESEKTVLRKYLPVCLSRALKERTRSLISHIRPKL